jgi:hypothetical protein
MPSDSALTPADVGSATLSIVCEPCRRRELYSVEYHRARRPLRVALAERLVEGGAVRLKRPAHRPI